jgi:hypothetical protein
MSARIGILAVEQGPPPRVKHHQPVAHPLVHLLEDLTEHGRRSPQPLQLVHNELRHRSGA